VKQTEWDRIVKEAGALGIDESTMEAIGRLSFHDASLYAWLTRFEIGDVTLPQMLAQCVIRLAKEKRGLTDHLNAVIASQPVSYVIPAKEGGEHG
jgi:hypothetical protein